MNKLIHIISKEHAKSIGMTRYFYAEICDRGHYSERYVKRGSCCECSRLRAKSREAEIINGKIENSLAEWISLGIGAKHLHIMSRDSAKSVGSRFYMTPKPCVNGHWSERRTSTQCCLECQIESQKTDSAKAYKKEYYASRPEKVLEYCARYREKHRERRNANNARWRMENIDSVRACIKNIGHKRRCQKASGVTAKELAAWQESQKKICYWCGKSCKKSFHIDHYVPLSKGGEHKLENLVIACPKCNLSKNAKDPYEFAKTMGLLF